MMYGRLAESEGRTAVARTSKLDGNLVINSWVEQPQSDKSALVKPAIAGCMGFTIVTASEHSESIAWKSPMLLKTSTGVSDSLA